MSWKRWLAAAVLSLATSTDSKLLVAGLDDGSAKVLDLTATEAAKAELLKLTPWDYTGKAAELAKRI